jgi:hypothetical protein
MAREIEALKRRNASLTRQLYPSPHGRVHVEGKEFSEDDDDETTPDEEEYVGDEGLRVEGYRGGDRRAGGGSLFREEPVMQEGHEYMQASDQRPPEGSGGDRANFRQRRRPLQDEPHLGEGAGRRLNFEGGNRQNPRAGYYQANPLPPQGDVHALIRSLEAKYDAVLRDMGGKPSAVDSIIQNARSAFTPRIMSHPVPGRFKVPPVRPYDGTGDPVGHLKSYKAHIDLHATTDEIACRAFPLTLEGSAQEWFRGVAC